MPLILFKAISKIKDCLYWIQSYHIYFLMRSFILTVVVIYWFLSKLIKSQYFMDSSYNRNAKQSMIIYSSIIVLKGIILVKCHKKGMLLTNIIILLIFNNKVYEQQKMQKIQIILPAALSQLTFLLEPNDVLFPIL